MRLSIARRACQVNASLEVVHVLTSLLSKPCSTASSGAAISTMNLFGTICVAVLLERENLAASALVANSRDQRRDFIVEPGKASR